MIFVKYTQYSPQIMEKSASNQLFLATASILGQAPSAPSSPRVKEVGQDVTIREISRSRLDEQGDRRFSLIG